MNKEWSEKNKKMQSLLKKETFSDGIKELIELRDMLMEEVDSWKYELDPKDYYKIPFINEEGYHSKTIAYSIYHIFRIEDIVVNSLIRKQEEVFFLDKYCNRMNSSIITTGNELIKKEISEFSKQLNLVELFKYAWAVKKSTDEWILSLTYEDLKNSFSEDDKKRLRNLGVVSTHENSNGLIDYWCDRDIKGLIKMPLSRHWIMHIEAAIRIMKKIGIDKKSMYRLIKTGTISSGIRYYIYEDKDGTVFAETLCNKYYRVANNLDEFNRIPIFKLENMIYSAEMSAAR